MQDNVHSDPKTLGRVAGLSLIVIIITGVAASFTIAKGIDINLSADVIGTAEAMMDAEMRLRAKAYFGLLTFGLNALFIASLFLLLRRYGLLLSIWSLVLGLTGSTLALLGSVFAMNAAHITGLAAYETLGTDAQRLMLTGLQATSDYTSFHLGLIISSAANAGFFWLLLRSKHIPKLIAGWGVFASLFVVSVMLLRDFIPALGHGGVTAAFMLANLVALVSTGLYLSMRGVRQDT